MRGTPTGLRSRHLNVSGDSVSAQPKSRNVVRNQLTKGIPDFVLISLDGRPSIIFLATLGELYCEKDAIS